MIRNFEITTDRNFKIGDKILCVDENKSFSITNGNVYKIECVNTNDNYIDIVNDNGSISTCVKNRFVKIVDKTEMVSTIEDINWAITGFTNSFNDTIRELELMKETLKKFEGTDIEVKFFRKKKELIKFKTQKVDDINEQD